MRIEVKATGSPRIYPRSDTKGGDRSGLWTGSLCENATTLTSVRTMQDSPHPLDRLQPEQLGSRLPDATGRRKRPKPGERRDQILQALASMLEQPGGERMTTAALAARLDVSEALVQTLRE